MVWHRMLARTSPWLPAVLLGLLALGCRDDEPTTPPPERVVPEPLPVLSDADEALLASLLSPDPADFYEDRARLWRLGEIRWPSSAAPRERPEPTTIARPLELVVVDATQLRVLLPLHRLDWQPPAPELVRVAQARESDSPERLWQALRITAQVGAGDLVVGLRRPLAPTSWLELDAGIPLTPLDGEGERLRVGWDDRECGFGLSLALDAADFGPLYRPGPAKPASSSAAPQRATSISLPPSAALFDSAEAREPLLRLHAESTIDPEGPGWVGLQITKTGAAKRGRTPVELECKGVTARGWVETKLLKEAPGRYALVEQNQPPAISSCEGYDEGESVSVGPGTPLFIGDALVGVVVEEVELLVQIHGAWMETCVPSPWGDLELRLLAR